MTGGPTCQFFLPTTHNKQKKPHKINNMKIGTINA